MLMDRLAQTTLKNQRKGAIGYMIKTYVIDTNVLIQAPYAIECFEENNLVLPLVVLEELDGLKKAEGEKGANARAAVRKLESYRQKGDLLQGVKLPGGGILRIEKNFVFFGWKRQKWHRFRFNFNTESNIRRMELFKHDNVNKQISFWGNRHR